jgi:ABC-type bacteriocin/lantibiotic exporter with double-glycine peptidase domain
MIVLSSLMFLLDPLLIKWLIDRVLPRKDFRLLLIAMAGFFGIYILRVGFSTLAGLVSFRTVQKLVFRIRLGILEQMNRLSADYHEMTPVGEKLYRMEQDVDQVAELGSSLVPYVLQTSFSTIFVVGTMAALDFRLTCLVLPLTPLFFVFRRHFEIRLRQASDSAQQQSSRESNFLQEHLTSVIQIQLLHREKSQIQGFLERATARMNALNHRNVVETLFRICYMVVIALGTITILGYGGYQVFVGALTVGGLVAFYSYMARLFDPLHAAVEIYSRINRLGTSIRRILEVIESTPSVPEVPTAVHFPSSIRGHIQMRGVTFCYGNGLPVLDRLDLRLEPGEKVALVGVSGSGKSTVTKLIARLYDVTQGAVYIDGIDVRNVSLECLRTKVCYLMQEAVLFDRTFKENLLMGKPSATAQELRRAIEITDLEELLQRSPECWDRSVGPRGNTLSGGERQRLALARAVLQNPSLLLLDESTSALDVPREQTILVKLAKHFLNRTIIFVSHRISALEWVDRIVVLNKGVIQEQGSHNQLMRMGGLYSRLRMTPIDLIANQGFSRVSSHDT